MDKSQSGMDFILNIAIIFMITTALLFAESKNDQRMGKNTIERNLPPVDLQQGNANKETDQQVHHEHGSHHSWLREVLV